MITVTKDEFFRYVGPRDIVASHENSSYSEWQTRDRHIIGRTYPGWKNPGDEKVYMLTEESYEEMKNGSA
jgi:hypothetical protein